MDSSAERSAARVAARVLAAPALLGPVRLVCIDGPAGSGKTTFATALGDAVRTAVAPDDGGCAGSVGAAPAVAVVHLDDLYDGWTGLEGSLWPRLSAQVLEPLRRGGPGCFQRYDWGAGRFGEWVRVDVPRVLVLEGCGSARRASEGLATLRVWVEAPAGLRLVRGLARDGEAARGHWVAWMAQEQAHFERERTRERADVRLDAWGTMPR